MSVFYDATAPENAEREAASIYGLLRYSEYSEPAAKFPRSDLAKRLRMTKFVDWKRARIRERVWIHIGVAAALIFGTPVLIAVGSYLWQWAVYSVAK